MIINNHLILFPDLEYLHSGSFDNPIPRKIVVFIIGGITYEESRAVQLFNKEQGTNVILGGTSILNFDSFVEEIKAACSS